MRGKNRRPGRWARAKTASLLAVIGALFVATVVVPSGTATADPPVDSGVVGSISVSRGSDTTRVQGWVSADRRKAPKIHVVVDDKLVLKFRPTQRRFDIEAAFGPAGRAWGFDVELDVRAAQSVCLSMKVDGVRRGIDCWYQSTRGFATALGAGPKFGTEGPLVKYSVEVEGRVGVHPEEFARIVDAILGDDRSWSGDGERRLRRVKPKNADVHFTLATPSTTDRLCVPFRTAGRLSCTVENHVVINSSRWFGAISHWTAGLDEYRAYVINHEIGHFLDFRHTGCPSSGSVAPIMLQQTKSLAGCEANGWPFP